MAVEGGSAREKAEALRRQAAESRRKADRMDSMAERWEAGELGERRVAAALAPLEGPNCRMLHDRLLAPGQSRVNLDHIVVSVAGTYLIDAKNFSGAVISDGVSLRQRDGRRRRLDDKVDKLRRMAEQMETVTSSVIEPVLCLAGESAAEFGPPATVRGVFVVPVDELASWLLARPRESQPTDLSARLARLAVAFPAATGPGVRNIAPMLGRHPGLPPASHAPRPAVRSRPAAVPRLTSNPRRASNRRPAGGSRRSARRRSSRPADGIKALLLLVLGLLLASAVGQRLVAGGITRMLATPPTRTPAPAAWVAPCTSVTDAAVSRAVGRPVYRYDDGPHDTCTWGLVARRSPTTPGVLRLATGWQAAHSTYPTAATARSGSTATSAYLTVPQYAAAPGSTAAATQPMLLVLTWKGTPLTAVQARRAVTALAGELARQLPTGLNATAVVRR